MRTCVTRKKPDRVYFYYACAKRREDRDACPNRRSYRADALEPADRRAVAGLLADPGRVRECSRPGYGWSAHAHGARPMGRLACG